MLNAKVYKKEDFDSVDEIIERLNWHSEMHTKLAVKMTALDMNFYYTDFVKNPVIDPEVYKAIIDFSEFDQKH